MAEMGDAFPRRDLGGSAENWGRHLEQRIVTLESAISQLVDLQGNTVRQNSGTSSNVANQMNNISEVLDTVQLQQVELSGIVNQLGATTYANSETERAINRSATPGAWSPWSYTDSLGLFNASTGQALILGTINAPAATLDEYIISCRFALSTGTEIGGNTQPTGSVWLGVSEASVAGASDERVSVRSVAMGVVAVTPGVQYTLRAGFQARDYGAGVLPANRPTVNQISMYVMPV